MTKTKFRLQEIRRDLGILFNFAAVKKDKIEKSLEISRLVTSVKFILPSKYEVKIDPEVLNMFYVKNTTLNLKEVQKVWFHPTLAKEKKSNPKYFYPLILTLFNSIDGLDGSYYGELPKGPKATMDFISLLKTSLSLLKEQKLIDSFTIRRDYFPDSFYLDINKKKTTSICFNMNRKSLDKIPL